MHRSTDDPQRTERYPAFEQFLRLIFREGWWIPVDAYVRDYSDTKSAINTRRSRGIWEDGVHSKYVEGSGLWINVLAVNSWVAKSKLKTEGRTFSPAPKRGRFGKT